MSPRQQLRAGRLPRRLAQLLAGLTIYGVSMAMMIRAQLGLDPWDVFHYGVATHLPLSFGTVTIVVGALVLLLWIPLRQMPGFGTVADVFVVGIATDLALSMLSAPVVLWQRGLMLAAGIGLNGLAGAMYIGSQLGPGPRDAYRPKCRVGANHTRADRAGSGLADGRCSRHRHGGLRRGDRADRACLVAPVDRSTRAGAPTGAHGKSHRVRADANGP